MLLNFLLWQIRSLFANLLHKSGSKVFKVYFVKLSAYDWNCQFFKRLKFRLWLKFPFTVRDFNFTSAGCSLDGVKLGPKFSFLYTGSFCGFNYFFIFYKSMITN